MLATDKCSQDCECELFLQAVDYVAMPQPMLVMAVMSLKSAKEDEWMYRLQEAESKDPYAHINNGFRALVNGDVEGAKSALNRHREHCAALNFVGASQLEKKLQRQRQSASGGRLPRSASHHRLQDGGEQATARTSARSSNLYLPTTPYHRSIGATFLLMSFSFFLWLTKDLPPPTFTPPTLSQSKMTFQPNN